MGEGTPPKFIEGQGPAASAPAQTELVLSNSVRQLDPAHDDAGVDEGLEAEHAGAPSFDGTVILLDDVIEILAAPNFHLDPIRVFPA